MNITLKHWKTFLIVAYSLGVIATVFPGSGRIPGWIVIPYYLLVPGYCLTVLLRQDKHLTDVLFYSLVWSLAVVGSVASVETIFLQLSALPLGAAVPSITLVVTAFDHYYR